MVPLPKRPTTIVIRPPEAETKGWDPKKKKVIIGVAAVALLVVGIVAYNLFAPEATTEKNEVLAPTEEGVTRTLVAAGEWRDADRSHHASGKVSIYQDSDGAFLFFEEFAATSGPDVYLYASPTADADSISGATKILVPGGAGDGRATLRGTFSVPLPANLDAGSIRSLVLWCDDYAVHFGTADLA